MIKNKIKTIENKIKFYEEGKIALTIKEVDALYQLRSDLKAEHRKTCKHDKAQIYVSHWVDKGYGLDRDYYNYAIRCNDCKQDLTDLKSCCYSNFKSEEAPIKTLVEKYTNLFTDEALQKVGIRRIKHTTETFTYV